MNKTLALLVAAGVAFSGAAFAADTKVETKTEATKVDAAGTKTHAETSSKSKTDAKTGETTTVEKTEKSVDPKGMLNKEKETTEVETKTDAAGNVVEQKAEVNGKEVSKKEAAPAAGKAEEKK